MRQPAGIGRRPAHPRRGRVSTLRQYLEALRARLEFVAVLEEDDRRVPVHLDKVPRAEVLSPGCHRKAIPRPPTSAYERRRAGPKNRL